MPIPLVRIYAVAALGISRRREKTVGKKAGIGFFFRMVTECNRNSIHWAIENPIGIMSNLYKKPSQIVHPYWFGDEARKSTCLWINRLPLLKPTKMVGRGEVVVSELGKVLPLWSSNRNSRDYRSVTFDGMAEAIALQWSEFLRVYYDY